MAEATSHRKRVAKPRGQAVKSPVTKQQPDDDSPSKRQCLNDIVNENVSSTSTKTEVKQRKTSSKEKDKAGFRSGHQLAESVNSSNSRSQVARNQGGRDHKEGKETKNRDRVEDSPLTPSRPAPRPPFSRNALPYASMPAGPPKPPRTYEQSPRSALYPSLSPTLGNRSSSETNRSKTVLPVPAPRGRTKGEPVQTRETGVFASDDGKYPVATQRCEKRRNTKENSPLDARDVLAEEPTRKPVSARLMEWQRLAEENKGTPGFCRVANGGKDFRAERSRKALSTALEKATPCPAPRSGTRSDSNDRLFCDVGETLGRTKDVGSAYEKIEEPFSVVQTGSEERSYRKQNDLAAVDSKTKTPQKKRNAPLPPSTIASNNKESKPKNRLYPDITDASTHDYFVLEEPGLVKQSKALSEAKALSEIPLISSSDIYGVSESDELVGKLSGTLGLKCQAGLSESSPEVCVSVCGNFRSDSRSNGHVEGNGYSLACATEDGDDNDENIYCEIDSPASVHGSCKIEKAYENSSCRDSKLKIVQTTRLDNDQHAVTKQRPVFSLDADRLAGNQSPAKSEKPRTPAMTPTSPGSHRLVWPKKAAPTITISHQMRSLSSDSRDEADDMDDLPFIPDSSVKQQLQMLQDLVYQELSVIHQTSNALAQCCHDLSAFSGSAEALECHRIILMACKKREAYMMEMQRLRDAHSSTDDAGPLGILTVSNIRLPLKPEFMSKIGTAFDTSVHHFVVLVRHGCNVIFTQLLSTHNAMVRSSLDFPDAFEIKDIRQNSFCVDVEVYGMSVERTPGAYSSKKKRKALNPMKALTPSCTRRALSPGGSVLGSVRTSNFINIATIRLDTSHLSKMNFSLDRIPFSSPLRGSIHLELGCQMESQIEEQGFLTMFEDRCGFGTWYRRWCVLKCNRLLYWKYPGEEHEKEPIGCVDLKHCISDKVDLVSRSYCARPNTFELLILKRPETERNDVSSIIHKRHDESDSLVKLWFSSDTKEERLNWCSQLNEALVNLRAWHSDAARPDKSQRQEHDQTD